MVDATKQSDFYGWWLLFFLWMVYSIPVGFMVYGAPVLYPFMIAELGWSRGKIMLGYTAIILLFGLTAPLIAWMIGRFGARLTIFFGGIVAAAAGLLMALGGPFYALFLVLSLMAGLGAALASAVPVQTVITFWFNVRRALAMGLVLGGGAIGGFIAPQVLGAVVQRSDGNWRVGWLMIAVACATAAVVAVMTVRDRPADMGQHPDGLAPEEVDAAATGSAKRARTYRSPINWQFRDAMRTQSVWLLLVGAVGTFLMWIILTTQAPFHLRDQGFGPEKAAFFYSLAIGLSVLGRFCAAFIGDRYEPHLIFTFGSVCILIGSILFWFASPQTMWAAYLFALLSGFGFGSAYICLPTIIGNYYGPEAFAPINGVIVPIMVLSHAAAAPLAGFIYDAQGSYFTVMLICWSAVVVAIAAMFFCTPPEVREAGLSAAV
ncbi:MFS transporter [Thermodesulfobacteriota bacterium]